jgi:hypothetical protein
MGMYYTLPYEIWQEIRVNKRFVAAQLFGGRSKEFLLPYIRILEITIENNRKS